MVIVAFYGYGRQINDIKYYFCGSVDNCRHCGTIYSSDCRRRYVSIDFAYVTGANRLYGLPYENDCRRQTGGNDRETPKVAIYQTQTIYLVYVYYTGWVPSHVFPIFRDNQLSKTLF